MDCTPQTVRLDGGDSAQAPGKGHALLVDRLEAHLRSVHRRWARVAFLRDASGCGLRGRRFAAGQSNPTFLVFVTGVDRDHVAHDTVLARGDPSPDGGGWPVVLRMQPRGSLLPGAHQLAREFSAMAAVQGRVPVPNALHLCTDTSVLGVQWYLMSYVHGRVFRDTALPSVPPRQRPLMYVA